MFKSKEELMEGKRGLICIGIEDAFKSIAERKDFYMKYKHQKLFDTNGINASYEEDIPFDEYRKYLKDNNLLHTVLTYNDWLFNHCFDGVK